MKTIKYLSLLFCAILLAQCDSPYEIPRATTFTVTTEPATKISATSANLSLTIGSNSGDGGYRRSGFFLNSDLSEAKTIYDNIGCRVVVATDLSPQTKYYYQAFIEDCLGNQIKGETLFFTTARDLITVTTLAAKNIGSTTANIYLRATPSQKPAEFLEAGFRVDDNANMSNPVSGVAGGTWPNYDIEVIELTPNTTYYYQGYVKEKDGERIYGNILSFTTLPETVSLWEKVPDSELSVAADYASSYGYGSDNYIYFMAENHETSIMKMWRYDINSGQWGERGDFPHKYFLVCASIWSHEEVGYFIVRNFMLEDVYQLWRYYGSSDIWEPLGNCPFKVSEYRASPILLYNGILTVMAEDQSAMWQCDITTRKWRKVENSAYPGSGRTIRTWFGYDDKLYAGLGCSFSTSPYTYFNDMWEFHVQEKRWTKKSDFEGAYDVVSWTCFELNGCGYFIQNRNYDHPGRNSWTYDYQKDDWSLINGSANLPFSNMDGNYFNVRNTIYVWENDKGGFWKFNPPLSNYGRAPKFRGQ